MPTQQLDRVVIPAGIFNPARTYSLVRDDDGLYLLFTGRAMGNIPAGIGPAHAIAGVLLEKIADKRSAEIAVVEERIRKSPPAAMAKELKNSRYLPKSEIKSVEIKPGGFTRVVVHADKKFKFHCWQDEQQLREFFAPLS